MEKITDKKRKEIKKEFTAKEQIKMKEMLESRDYSLVEIKKHFKTTMYYIKKFVENYNEKNKDNKLKVKRKTKTDEKFRNEIKFLYNFKMPIFKFLKIHPSYAICEIIKKEEYNSIKKLKLMEKLPIQIIKESKENCIIKVGFKNIYKIDEKSGNWVIRIPTKKIIEGNKFSYQTIYDILESFGVERNKKKENSMKLNSLLTTKDIKQLKEHYYNEDIDIKETAEIKNFSVNALKKIYNQINLKMTNEELSATIELNIDTIKKIREKLKENIPYNKIIDENKNVNLKKIKKIIYYDNFNNSSSVDKEKRKEIIKTYQNKPEKTIKEISIEIGVSEITINRILLRNNIPRNRNLGERRN